MAVPPREWRRRSKASVGAAPRPHRAGRERTRAPVVGRRGLRDSCVVAPSDSPADPAGQPHDRGDQSDRTGDQPDGRETGPDRTGDRPDGQETGPDGQGDEPDGQGDEPGGQGDEPGGQGDEPGGQGDEPGGQGDEPGSQGDEPDGERPAPTLGAGAPRLVITPIIAMVVANNIGNALFPTLLTDHPLLLIALSPSNRNFVLVANQVDPVSFYVIGTLRLLAPDPLFFLLGRWYGDAAISWMEQRTPTFGQLMRTLERWFAKASWPLVLVIPDNPVCLLAGASGMGVVIFATLNVVGTIGRLVLLRVTGRLLADPIDWIVHLVGEYRIPLLVLTVGLVAFTVVREWRAGTSEIEQLIELEEDLEDLDDSTGAG